MTQIFKLEYYTLTNTKKKNYIDIFNQIIFVSK